MADDYTPSDEQVRTAFVEGMSEDCYAMSWHEPFAEGYDRWLAAHDAQVKRDAAREALTTLAAEHQARSVGNGLISDMHLMAQQRAEAWRDHTYPEKEDQT